MIRVAMLAAALVAVLTQAAFAQTLKIGAILSTTGNASYLGEPQRNTLNMLAEQVNQAGGIAGHKVELVIYDDESDVNKAVLAAEKLLKRDKVAALIGPSISANSLAIMGKFAEAGIPIISCSAAEKITTPINPFVFKTPQSDRQAVQRILEHAKTQGISKVALLTASDTFGQAGREVAKDLIGKTGFTLSGDEVFSMTDTDVTPQLTKIKDSDAQAVICWGINRGPTIVAIGAKQLGLKIPLYMSHGVASKKFIENTGDAAQGLLLPAGKLTVYQTLPDTDPQKAVLTAYARDYEARFKIPVSTFGGYAYDAFALLKQAVEMKKSIAPADMRAGIEAVKGLVAISGVFNMSPEDHNGLSSDSFVMVRIDGQDFKIIQ